jgi:hypothetical protein
MLILSCYKESKILSSGKVMKATWLRSSAKELQRLSTPGSTGCRCCWGPIPCWKSSLQAGRYLITACNDHSKLGRSWESEWHKDYGNLFPCLILADHQACIHRQMRRTSIFEDMKSISSNMYYSVRTQEQTSQKYRFHVSRVSQHHCSQDQHHQAVI